MSRPQEDARTSTTVAVSGEVDIATVGTALAPARDQLAAGVAVLSIDLGAVTFIDSSGLGALVKIRNDAAAQGSSVVLTNLSSPVRRLFEISGLDQVFDIAPGS